MAIKFANILAALGIGSTTEAVTEAHLQAADDRIAQLEQDKAAADLKATQAAADLKAAEDEKAKVASDLDKEKGKVAQLEKWKQEQKAVDGRDEDDSNALDEDGPEAKASWEIAAASAIANTKKRLGEK